MDAKTAVRETRGSPPQHHRNRYQHRDMLTGRPLALACREFACSLRLCYLFAGRGHQPAHCTVLHAMFYKGLGGGVVGDADVTALRQHGHDDSGKYPQESWCNGGATHDAGPSRGQVAKWFTGPGFIPRRSSAAISAASLSPSGVSVSFTLNAATTPEIITSVWSRSRFG